MHPDGAQLTSITSAIDDLTERVTAIADRHAGTHDELVAGALYEVERNLQAAARRLSAVIRDLG